MTQAQSTPHSPPSGQEDGRDAIWAYHRRSSHSAAGYAPGPAQLDWAAQPDPFRRYGGAPLRPFPPAVAEGAGPAACYGDLFLPGAVPAVPLSRQSLGQLLALSLGITGWKQMGPDRWAVRAVPSSGNLHPTECYVLASGLPGLGDGLYHYHVASHGLEWRCAASLSAGSAEAGPGSSPDARPPRLWIGLSSILEREAWKYGLRAFRYTQLDLGHARAALGFAAALLGWRVTDLGAGAPGALAGLLGLDRAADFAEAEPEEPECLLALHPQSAPAPGWPRLAQGHWHGRPSRCDPARPAPWPGLAAVTRASRPGRAVPGGPARETALPAAPAAPLPPSGPAANLPHILRPSQTPRAAQLIAARRSARQFTSKTPPDLGQILGVLRAGLPQAGPLAGLSPAADLPQMVIAIHKLAGLAPGLYALPHDPAALRAALHPDLTWAPLPGPAPLVRLQSGDLRRKMRGLACNQGLGAEGAATVIFLSDLGAALAQGPDGYRRAHRAAGQLGQALYLEASARGLGASGIGCFLDHELQDWLLAPRSPWRPLYLFGLGRARPDPHLLADAPNAPDAPAPAPERPAQQG